MIQCDWLRTQRPLVDQAILMHGRSNLSLTPPPTPIQPPSHLPNDPIQPSIQPNPRNSRTRLNSPLVRVNLLQPQCLMSALRLLPWVQVTYIPDFINTHSPIQILFIRKDQQRSASQSFFRQQSSQLFCPVSHSHCV